MDTKLPQTMKVALRQLAESSRLKVLAATEDSAEGMNAFIEKREATWKGR